MSFLGEEMGRLTTIEERHRRLAARLLLVVISTVIVTLLGTVGLYLAERHAHGTQIHTFGQAAFFASVQVVTVSSSLTNPVTPAGRVVDVLLEAWGVLAVTGIGGAIATFFLTGDR